MSATIVTQRIAIHAQPPFVTTTVEIEPVGSLYIGIDAVAEFVGCHATDPQARIQFESEPLAVLISRKGECTATLMYVIDLDQAQA